MLVQSWNSTLIRRTWPWIEPADYLNIISSKNEETLTHFQPIDPQVRLSWPFSTSADFILSMQSPWKNIFVIQRVGFFPFFSIAASECLWWFHRAGACLSCAAVDCGRGRHGWYGRIKDGAVEGTKKRERQRYSKNLGQERYLTEVVNSISGNCWQKRRAQSSGESQWQANPLPASSQLLLWRIENVGPLFIGRQTPPRPMIYGRQEKSLYPPAPLYSRILGPDHPNRLFAVWSCRADRGLWRLSWLCFNPNSSATH